MVGSGYYEHFKEMTEASPQIVYAVNVLNQMETLIKCALFDINEHKLERTRERLLKPIIKFDIILILEKDWM